MRVVTCKAFDTFPSLINRFVSMHIRATLDAKMYDPGVGGANGKYDQLARIEALIVSAVNCYFIIPGIVIVKHRQARARNNSTVREDYIVNELIDNPRRFELSQ